MQRKEAKEQTRKRLLESAREVFRTQGVRETKISDITNRAKVAQGTFYTHFENREAVVDELVGTISEGHKKALVNCALTHMQEGTRALIEAQARVHICYWREHSDYFSMLVDNLARHSLDEPLPLRDSNENVVRFAETVLQDCKIAARVSAKELARIIINLWRHAGLNAARNEALDIDDAAKALSLSTIAIYESLAPGLVDIDLALLAATYATVFN